jgi:hypothetical protein
VYLGAPAAPFSPDYANLYSASSADAFVSGSSPVVAGAMLSSNLGDGSGSCGSPFTFTGVNLPVSRGSFSLTTGAALFFEPNIGGQTVVCTGHTAGGQDTPTSLTITGTMAEAVTTTTSTTTSSSANGVPQFPIPNLSAILLVALLLPVVVLMARARKSNAPVLSD